MSGREVVLCAVGDLCFAGALEPLVTPPASQTWLDAVRPAFAGAQVTFANLECGLTRAMGGLEGQAHLIKAAPECVSALSALPFNVVSVANNHIYDFRDDGLQDTLRALDAAAISYCGAGKDLAAARREAALDTGGMRLAFLAYAASGVQTARRDRPGAAPLDRDLMLQDVRRLVATYDHVIVSIHTGLEFLPYPDPDLRSLCRDLAGAGARLVIGHGPHVFQGTERAGESLICYSLGNFAFDPGYMDYETPLSRQGLVLRATLVPGGVSSYELIPVVLGREGRPAFAGAAEEGIRAHLQRITADLASPTYASMYRSRASQLWSSINIRVNLKVLREQGLLAFMRRLPRFKWKYFTMLARFVGRRAYSLVRSSSNG
jgi:poly-gamma-glutamate synthesis protein (capsule biosynthesis protein)